MSYCVCVHAYAAGGEKGEAERGENKAVESGLRSKLMKVVKMGSTTTVVLLLMLRLLVFTVDRHTVRLKEDHRTTSYKLEAALKLKYILFEEEYDTPGNGCKCMPSSSIPPLIVCRESYAECFGRG